MRPGRAIACGVVAGALLLVCASPKAQVARPAPADRDALDIIQVRPNIHLIAGAGGNIVVQTGSDGTVLVDTGRADAADRVLAAIKRITDQPISLIINTSPDADFVGGNVQIGKAGRNIFGAAVGETTAIYGSEKVLLRMSAPTGEVSPFPPEAWPTDTFSEPRKDVYFNKEAVQIIQVPAGHSDGVSVVFFRASDVVVTGALIDTTRFPVINVAKGGSIQGEIDGLNRVIDLAVRPLPFVFDEGGTYIVPGRGRVYDKIDAVEYRDMMVVIRDRVQDMIRRGLTLEQVKAGEPTKGYQRQFGATTGPWTTDNFVEAVYKSLTAKK